MRIYIYLISAYIRAVLIGDVNFLNFLPFFQDFHEKKSVLLSSGGLFVFFPLILGSKTATTHTSSHARRHAASMSEYPGRPQRKAPRPSRFVQSGDSSPWCQEHAEHDEDTSDSPLHVYAPRVWIIEQE